MRKEANLEQWKELYELGEAFRKLKPWEYFDELDLVTILLPEVEEPYYCSIMGSIGEPLGVTIYSGFKAIQGFLKVASSEEIPESQLIRYEDCIVIYFGEKENLFNEEVEVLEKLNFNYNSNSWTFCRSVKKGYAPYMLDENEVLESSAVIKELNNAIISYREKVNNIDLNKGETLLRCYNDEKGIWENKITSLFLGNTVYENIILNDKNTLNLLIDRGRVNSTLELDIIYLESVIDDKEYERPIIPRLCLLADHYNGYILDQEILTPKNDDVQELLKSLINYIKVVGRPESLYVRDEHTKSILRHLCKKLGIELKIKERLLSIDSICKGLFEESY